MCCGVANGHLKGSLHGEVLALHRVEVALQALVARKRWCVHSIELPTNLWVPRVKEAIDSDSIFSVWFNYMLPE